MLKGKELADFILNAEQANPSEYVVKELGVGKNQSKVIYKKKKPSEICYTKIAYNGTAPDSYRTITHELGHFFNNKNEWGRVNELFKMKKFFYFLLGFLVLFDISFYSFLKNLNNHNSIATSILLISIFLIIIGAIYSKRIYKDEKRADDTAKQLVKDHLANAMVFSNDHRVPADIKVATKQEIIEGEKYQNNYTFFIMAFSVLPLVFILPFFISKLGN